MKCLLVGRDSEGDARESWYEDASVALQSALTMMVTDWRGPAWRGWELWANNPAKNDAWECVAVNPS